LASHWLRIAHFFSIEVFSLSSYIVDQYEKHKSTLDYATLGVKYESKRKFWDCFFDAHNKQYVELKGVDVEAQLEKLRKLRVLSLGYSGIDAVRWLRYS